MERYSCTRLVVYKNKMHIVCDDKDTYLWLDPWLERGNISEKHITIISHITRPSLVCKGAGSITNNNINITGISPYMQVIY